MCYRYSIYSKPELIEARFNAKMTKSFDRRYEVSPFEQVKLPVITNDRPHDIQFFSWGLIPFWVKDSRQAAEMQKRTVNARGETIFEKPAFHHAATQNHCLVLVDGFYEWRQYQGKKYPYFIRLKDAELFALAGLWDHWMDPTTGEEIHTYAIITTRANPLMEVIHNSKKRMPVMLSKTNEQQWITPHLSKEEYHTMLDPFDEYLMEAYTISRLITSTSQDRNVPQVIEPYTYAELEGVSYGWRGFQ